MNMEFSELGENRVKVVLKGRLDTPGVGRIGTNFVTVLVSKGRSAIIDLSEVEFIGSLGIRMFLIAARGLETHNARLVLFGPHEPVRETLEDVSLDSLIPIAADERGALAALES